MWKGLKMGRSMIHLRNYLVSVIKAECGRHGHKMRLGS